MIVGVDVGTSMTKADAYDDDGRKLASAERASRLEQFADGRVEQDLEDVVSSVVDVVRRVVAEAGRPVRALALTGQGDGLWLRDADGAATRPPISWLDDRAADVVRAWQDDGTVAEVYRRTGVGLFPGCHAPLLTALGRDEPESLERAVVAGYCVDALVQRLTGEITVDASDASLPFLDVVSRTYDEGALAACGLGERRGLLAEPAPSGTVFALDRRGAELLGLPEGTPVTGGPFDLPACAVGAGLSTPGDGLLIIGTTLACEVFTDRVDPDVVPDPAGMWLCTPQDGLWLRAMPAMVGTAGLDWLLDFLGVGIDALEDLLAGTSPGPGASRRCRSWPPRGSGRRSSTPGPGGRSRASRWGPGAATSSAPCARASPTPRSTASNARPRRPTATVGSWPAAEVRSRGPGHRSSPTSSTAPSRCPTTPVSAPGERP